MPRLFLVRIAKTGSQLTTNRPVKVESELETADQQRTRNVSEVTRSVYLCVEIFMFEISVIGLYSISKQLNGSFHFHQQMSV